MNDKERNLQRAMMSFALWGGMLVNTKQVNAGPAVSHPASFTPISIKRPR